MSPSFIDEIQVDELESLIEEAMYEVDEDVWDSITESDIDDWSGVEFDF